MEHNNCGLCVGKVCCVNEDGTPNDKTFPIIGDFHTGIVPNDVFMQKYFCENSYPFHTISYFCRIEVFNDRYKFDFKKYLNGDICFLLTAVLHGGIYYLDKKLSCRRLNVQGSWTYRSSLFNKNN